MQVVNDKNFIFEEWKMIFGALYKMLSCRERFLNTFTPCNFPETALQFLYIMQKYGQLEKNAFKSFGKMLFSL